MTEYEITHGLSQDAPGPLEPLEPVEVAKVPAGMNTSYHPCTDERMCSGCFAGTGCTNLAPTSHPIPTGATGEEQDESGMSPYCPECDGGGRISVLSDNSPDAHDVDIDCTHCGGSGSAVDAAKNLARALQSERMQHLQIYGEYKNFHRSLCARFGYGHDPVHFRRDLVSLEEAIAAKVSAPAAGDALDAARYRWLRDPKADPALVLDKRTGYVPEDESVPGVGGYHTYEYRAGEELDAAIDAALAAQIPQQGEA